jgi:ADP-ribose pyrophosphatase YjhB (NUDIX family)
MTMWRRLFHVYWRFQRGVTLGVRGMVLDAEGRVLLVRHGYVDGWHLPGGGVEPGETLLDALGRELLEEGNVKVAGVPMLHAVYYNNAASRRDHVALFVVREFEYEGPHAPSFEIQESGFFSPDALPEGTTAATRRRLAEVLHATPAPAHW